MLEHDPRTGKAHHFGNLFSVLRLVAMDLAFGADGLSFLKGTAGKPLHCLVGHFLTGPAHCIALQSVMRTAVDTDHGKHGVGFALKRPCFEALESIVGLLGMLLHECS